MAFGITRYQPIDSTRTPFGFAFGSTRDGSASQAMRRSDDGGEEAGGGAASGVEGAAVDEPIAGGVRGRGRGG